MAYILNWKNPALNANKAAAINVPVGAVVSNKASLRFTGKGAPGYGSIQQENLMRLLESFADGAAPLYPTVGQSWFDTNENTMKVCTSTTPLVWKSLGGVQVTGVGANAPSPAAVGDVWFQKTGTRSGIMYVYTGVGRHPVVGSTIGGWNQVWPPIETIAGREEYDVLATMVFQLIGSTGNGGAAAIGKNIPDLTSLTTLDADLLAKHAASPDANVLVPTTDSATELKVDPISTDWDLLLSAARYAVSRLDLPANMLDDISPVPFVSDGRPAPTALTTLPATDVRYPSLERRSNRRFGIVTLIRAFTETYNVLTAAVANRYSLKGISGASGTNPDFAPSTEIAQLATFSGSPGGATSETITMRFNFATNADLLTFLNSGGAVQITMSHIPTGAMAPADIDLKNLLNNVGVLRLTADKSRVFANVYPLRFSITPTNVGLRGTTATQTLVPLQQFGGASMAVTGSTPTATSLSVTIALAAGSAISGTTTVRFEIISDATTYGTAGARAFGTPIPFAPADKTGSAFLVQV